jgi:AhpD family alkylhydroperoxidase
MSSLSALEAFIVALAGHRQVASALAARRFKRRKIDPMTENWIEMTTEMSNAVGVLRAGAPDVMKGFSALAHAALQRGALDPKTKELIALAIAVAVRCDPCIAFHAEAAVKRGVSREEVLEAMGLAIYMGAGPSAMYAAQALEAVDQFRERDVPTV